MKCWTTNGAFVRAEGAYDSRIQETDVTCEREGQVCFTEICRRSKKIRREGQKYQESQLLGVVKRQPKWDVKKAPSIDKN